VGNLKNMGDGSAGKIERVGPKNSTLKSLFQSRSATKRESNSEEKGIFNRGGC